MVLVLTRKHWIKSLDFGLDKAELRTKKNAPCCRRAFRDIGAEENSSSAGAGMAPELIHGVRPEQILSPQQGRSVAPLSAPPAASATPCE